MVIKARAVINKIREVNFRGRLVVDVKQMKKAFGVIFLKFGEDSFQVETKKHYCFYNSSTLYPAFLKTRIRNNRKYIQNQS